MGSWPPETMSIRFTDHKARLEIEEAVQTDRARAGALRLPLINSKWRVLDENVCTI